jgi:arsenate reductase
MTGRAIDALRIDLETQRRQAACRVIFACRGNAGRSQMAAAFFNHLADPRRARAISAGLEPSSTVELRVIEAMSDAGIALWPSIPRRLSPPLAMTAGHLITIGCEGECPFYAGVKVEEWPIDDPRGLPIERVRGIRDEIRERVQQMIDVHAWSSPTT